MGRLIDVDALCDAFRHDIMGGLNWDRILREAKTVDAVEVVRCKDCKFYYRMTAETGICKLACRHLGNDGFCSEGERKDSSNETD